MGYIHRTYPRCQVQIQPERKERAVILDNIRHGNVNPFQAELIPDLEKYGFIKTVDGKKEIAVPVLTRIEYDVFQEINKIYGDTGNMLLDKAVIAKAAQY